MTILLVIGKCFSRFFAKKRQGNSENDQVYKTTNQVPICLNFDEKNYDW